MRVEPPLVQRLGGGRLHLSQGPIDVVLKAEGAGAAAAYDAVARRFRTCLAELCAELPCLRAPCGSGPEPESPIGRRMAAACRPFAGVFLTPMAAVAGAVADELLATMRAAGPLTRAWVNDGGDIALWCAPDEALEIGIAGDFAGVLPRVNGHLRLAARDGIGGIATSGAQGRSFSLGVADSVTVLAGDAATADAAATLVANAVDCDDPAIERCPAEALDPDSDLGGRLVTRRVGALPRDKVRAALARGRAVAAGYRARGLIAGAALMLQGEATTLTPERILERIAP